MANTSAISQIGGALAGGGGSNTTGIPTGGGNPPGAVTAITATGFVDPVARECFLTITFTAPTDPGDTFTGVHIYLDIPDHGDGTTQANVGSNVGSMILPGFSPIDLGIQSNPQQPWEISFPFPENRGLDINASNPARLYVASVSVVSANQLIQDGQPNATPNQAFTLVPTTSGQPTAGTNITANCGTIICQPLGIDKSTGKQMAPFLATMGSVPANPPKGWGYRLYLYTGTDQPADVSAMTPLTDVCTNAGLVPSGKSDLVVDVLNSFAIQNPTTPTSAVVYAVAGLVGADGTFTANNIVQGITNGCPITLGTNSGTVDAASMELASLAAEMQVSGSLFGLAVAGVTNSFLGNAAVETINVQALAITNPLLASLCVGTANYQALSIDTAAIQTLAVTSALIANLAVGNAQIQNGAILNAQLGTAVVAFGNIASCSISSLIAGTATFTGTAIFQNSSGPYVEITSSEVLVAGGSYTIGVNSSTGISISSSGASLAITSSAITITNGSYSATFGASSVVLAYSGGPNLSLFASSIFLTATASDYIQVTSGTITITSSGLTTTITGNAIDTGQVTAQTFIVVGAIQIPPSGFSSAVAGSLSLPSNPYVYLKFWSDQVSGYVLVPAYNI